MNNRELLFIIKARNLARSAISAFRKQIKDTGKAAKQTKAALDGMGRSAGRVADNASRAARSLKQVNAARMSRIVGGVNKLKTTLKTAALAALNLKSLLIGFSTLIIGRFIIKTLIEFGDEMAKVRAISGATTEQFAALEEEARRLGATTRFSATEAAEGLTFLSRAGFTAQESIQAIGPALNLAQAGALDLGRAADILSNIMSAFSIDAGRAVGVTDVLSSVVNSANTNMEQLGDAMKFVGPIARAVGFDINEVAAAIGALGDSGLQGTLAGTGLRISIQKLLNPTKSARRALQAMNISLSEVDPTANSLRDILERLALAQKEVGSGEFARNVAEIFSARGATAVLALTNQIGKFQELDDQSRISAGVTARTAAIMDATLGGTLKGLTSALSEVVIGLGKLGADPIFQGIIAGITDVVRGLGALIKGFGLSETSAETLAQALSGITKVLFVFGATLLGGPIAGGIALLLVGLGELGKISFILGDNYVSLGDIMQSVFARIRAFVSFTFTPLIALIKAAALAMSGDWAEAGQSLNKSLDGMREDFKVMFQSISDGIRATSNEFSEDFLTGLNRSTDFATGLKKNNKNIKLSADLIEEFKATISGLRASFAPGLEALAKFVEGETDLLEILGKTDAQIKQTGSTRVELTKILEGLAIARFEEANAINVSIQALERESILIGKVGVDRAIAQARLQAETAARLRDRTGGGAIDEPAFLRLSEKIKINSQREFIAVQRKAIRQQAIQNALLGRAKVDVDRITVALKAMEAAQSAGFDTATVRKWGEVAVKSFDDAKKALEDFNKSGEIGVKRAFTRYIEEARDFAQQFENLTTNALNKVEDAFVDFVKTGKFNFKDLIASISADLLRLQVKGLVADISEALSLGTKKKIKTPADAAAQAAAIMKEAGVTAAKVIDDTGIVVRDMILSAADVMAKALLDGAERLRNVPIPSARPSGAGGDPVTGSGLPEFDLSKFNLEIPKENIIFDPVDAIQDSLDQMVFELDNDIVPIKAFEPGGELDAQARLSIIEMGTRLSDLNAGFVAKGEEGTIGFGDVLDGLTRNMNTITGDFKTDFANALLSLTKSLTQSGGFFGGGSSGGGILGDLFSGLFSGGGTEPGIGDFAGLDFLFAKGGIQTARGAVKLKRFAEGGVTSSPSLAVFGEGSRPEAFVPLPDGRRIPVEMSGTDQGRPMVLNVTINVSTPDAQSFGRNQNQIARQAAIALQRTMSRDN